MSEAPRVLMIVRLFHPWIGGTERQAHKLAIALQAAGTDTRIVTGRWFRGTARAEVLDGVPITRVFTMWEGFGVRGLRRVGGYLFVVTLSWHLWRRRGDYDVIHVHGLNYHTAVAVAVGHRLGKPVLAKLANSGPASDIGKLARSQQLPLSGHFLPTALGCDRFVALNPTIVEELAAVGVARDCIVEIPNGVVVPPMTESFDAVSARRVVLFVGRLHEQKNLDVLIRAARVIEDRRPGAAIVRLVGDGPERARLEALSAASGLGGVVDFAGSSDAVEEELRAAAVFVLPSSAEGLSNALLEAMAAALAVVVSDIPGNRDVVTHEVDGLCVPPGDHEAVAEAIISLLDDPVLARRLGTAAREHAQSRYGADAVARRYLQVYAELVGGVRDGELVGAP
jgi:glycosyltransferase involved in cell wall biosynthesis